MVYVFKKKDMPFSFVDDLCVEDYDEEFFDIIEYEDVYEIKKFIVTDDPMFYMIQTKENSFRMQISDYDFDQHDIFSGEDAMWLVTQEVKAGTIWEQILEHMKKGCDKRCEL